MTNISSGIRHTVYSKLIRLKEMIVLWMVMLEIAQDCSTKRVRLKKKCGKGGKRLLKTQFERLQSSACHCAKIDLCCEIAKLALKRGRGEQRGKKKGREGSVHTM